jgi:hypothetical protein
MDAPIHQPRFQLAGEHGRACNRRLAKVELAGAGLAERHLKLFPPPRPSAEPSLLYRKLRGGGRQR